MATDIAARGIHVDDVALVVHADPPVEHKAYLHRSGRTARAGAAGTVVTLMTDEQVRDVRSLTRQAGIKPVTTRVAGPDHPILGELAPGERTLVAGGYAPAGGSTGGASGSSGSGSGGRRRGRGNGGSRGRGRGRGQSGSQPSSQDGPRKGGRSGSQSRKTGGRSSGSGSHSAAGFSGRR